MRLLPADPDIGTLIARISSGDLNLQPDFQRGEVWTRVKKQRLVDSVLRDWHVPPVHVIELTDSKRQEVLDGQQRLVAIRDFARGDFAIDGRIEPFDERIASLHGLRYVDLPEDIRRQFNQFPIRIYRIVDYQSSEPAELFFRLNQPTNLTSAEQRNAFFGPVREQIKGLSQLMTTSGLERSFLGFSNSRMAYDDVLCRVALSVNRKSISEKITANDLVEIYRGDVPLDVATEDAIRRAVLALAGASKFQLGHPKFNKASLYSWLIFLIRVDHLGPDPEIIPRWVADFLHHFSHLYELEKIGFLPDDHISNSLGLNLSTIFTVYEDRSTSRVADVSSVLLRDAAIWLVLAECLWSNLLPSYLPVPSTVFEASKYLGETVDEEGAVKTLIQNGWGSII